jgi:hypothetical protein
MILGKDNTTSKALSFKKLKTHNATSSSGQIPEKNYYLSVYSYYEMSAVSSNNQISDELNLSSSLTEGFHTSHLHNCTVNIYRDIFSTLNMAHTYSLCSILKNTDQCIVSCYGTNYTEHQKF